MCIFIFVVLALLIRMFLVVFFFLGAPRFVNLMDGHIWLESEGLGKGCTAIFMVKLGLRGRSNEAKLQYMSRAPVNHGRTNFTGLKVIVMDDNGLVDSVPF